MILRGRPLTALVRIAVVSALISLPMSAADVALHGRVVDENDAPVRAAKVTVRPATGSRSFDTQTDPNGAFAFTIPSPGDFLVTVEREGYYALKNQTVHVETTQELTLVINSVREVFQSENVNAETSPVDVDQTQNQERLTGTEVNDMPYANSHSLRSSLQLMPGVVEEGSGALHVNGSSENQLLYTLNGFNITNPISGQFQTLLAVDGIRSLDLSSGRTSPEFGKGSAGVLNIATENGTDAFHYTATDFVPGLGFQRGVRFGNWYPRVGVSGPIVKGRAWFSDTFDMQFTESLITGLPSGADTRSGWAGSNLLHTQVNLTPSNILFADFLVNVDNEGRVGLGPLNPVPTTSSLHTHEYFASFKDQQYFGGGVLVEFGYAHNDYSAAQYPQGQSLYIFSSQGNEGNYFVNATQGATRNQGLIHAWLPQFRFAGSHRIESGIDADLLHYNADFRDTGYEVVGLSGQLISETLFEAPAAFHLTNTEVSSWLLDTWRLSKRLQFTLGMRQDWDRRIPNLAWSPRAGFSWSPFASGRTRVSGGYTLTHDATTLDILGRPLNQTAFTTQYNSNGTAIEPAVPTTFTIGNAPLVLPRATNWTLGADHQLFTHVFLNAKYLRRRGTDGFAFVNSLAPNAPPSLLPLPAADSAGVYQLTNLRRDSYDSVQVSVRQTFSGQYEWMASYTRSRALSNAVLDPNTSQPLQVLPNLVPMPWDAPNRLLTWAYLPLPQGRLLSRFTKNWSVSAMADMRTGFPFSVRDQTGLIAGAVDSYRYPMHFDLNISIERMLTLRGYRFALRGGVDNLTNQRNPTAVNNVIGTPQFPQFFGYEGRHYVVRIRFFGRAK
jgi:hypothetical protein